VRRQTRNLDFFIGLGGDEFIILTLYKAKTGGGDRVEISP